MISEFGFVRLATAVPIIALANPEKNSKGILELLIDCQENNVDIVVFPELCLTGYSCQELFFQTALHEASLQCLLALVQESKAIFNGIAIVGLPLVVDTQLLNCAVVFQGGRILGIVPKTYLPNYKEFYESRYFTSARRVRRQEIVVSGETIPLGTDLLFQDKNDHRCVFGIEICEDLWMPIPPSSIQASVGASLLFNLSASNETIGKATYRRELVSQQSARCLAAYVYCSAGWGESSTDLVFGGHCLIAENGVILAESERFQMTPSLSIADVDLQRLQFDRTQSNSFNQSFLSNLENNHIRYILCDLPQVSSDQFLNHQSVESSAPVASLDSRRGGPKLRRSVFPHPFAPAEKGELNARCREIFDIQISGLAKRLAMLPKQPIVIGISGGLDSTLALLVTCKALARLTGSTNQLLAITMPGFGTSERTKNNAKSLVTALEIPLQEIDIREICFAEMKLIGHNPFQIDIRQIEFTDFCQILDNLESENHTDLIFENVQARMRTSILMNRGFVIGTGDLSELALGWCTYNADHMSMYNPNASIPKTLVQFLVRWVAENEVASKVADILLDILDTPISPELLPSGKNRLIQSTESTIGPYELHDFFLYYFLRFGTPPEKILFLAKQAKFNQNYDDFTIRKWLKVFIKRFFQNQFKRSCLPDGPKVGSVSLSPRGDWRMPSDAEDNTWLKWAIE